MKKLRSTFLTDGSVDWFITISLALALLLIGAGIGILLIGGK